MSLLIPGAFASGTVAAYYAARRLHRRFSVPWLSPVLIAPLLLIAGLYAARQSTVVYYQSTRWLLWFLGPATVAFAFPIYQQRALIRRYPLSIASGVVAGTILGVASSWVVARGFALSPELSKSLLLRSISTPFALEAARITGASSELTSMAVILTGLLGLAGGELVLLCQKPRSALAKGALWGAASHVIGTARAHQDGGPVGAISSLVMIFSGVILILAAPLIQHL